MSVRKARSLWLRPLCLALAWAVEAAAAEDRSSLVPLPELRLEHAESGLRERLGEARSALDWMLSEAPTDDRELARAFGELGRLYLASGLHSAAAAALANARELAPQEFQWAYYLGALLHDERQLEKSAAVLHDALKLAPQDIPTRLRLADAQLLSGHIEEAAAGFESVLATNPAPGGRAFAHHRLGKISAQAEDWRRAAEHFKAALEAAPEASAVRRLLGLAYRELGDRERARRELAAGGAIPVSFADPLMESLADLDTGAYLWSALHARRRGDLDAAADLYRRAVAAQDGVASHHRSLADVLALQGKLDEALAELERAVELDPAHVSSLIQLGELLARREGLTDLSLGYLEKAAELAPDAPEPKLALARNLALAQRHAEALPYYDALVVRDPRRLRTRILRARTLARLGRDAEAVRDLEAVLARDSRHPRASIDLATVLSRQGETGRARALFEQALELELSDGDRGLALFGSAALHQQLGDDAAAIPLYRRALELVPDMRDAHFNLAAALARSGQVAAATPHFRRAVEIAPGDVAARLAWVRALLTGGDYAQARAALEAGIGTDVAGADPQLLHLLAQLLSTCPDPALRDAERAVELATLVLNQDATIQRAVTLARALAEARRVEEAVALQRRIVADAERLGLSPAQKDQLRRVLAYYESLLTPLPPGGGAS